MQHGARTHDPEIKSLHALPTELARPRGLTHFKFVSFFSGFSLTEILLRSEGCRPGLGETATDFSLASCRLEAAPPPLQPTRLLELESPTF